MEGVWEIMDASEKAEKYFLLTPRVITENTLSTEAWTGNVKKNIVFLNSKWWLFLEKSKGLNTG